MAHGHDERKHSGFGQACSHAAAWNRSPAMELLCPARRCPTAALSPFLSLRKSSSRFLRTSCFFFCDLDRKRAFPAEAGGVPYRSAAEKCSGGLPLRELHTSH